MDKDKNRDLGEELALDELSNQEKQASRARNRTVMLTPEMTGEVRARLAEEAGAAPVPPAKNGAGIPSRTPPQPAFGNSYGGSAPQPDIGEEGFVRPQTFVPPAPRAAPRSAGTPPASHSAPPSSGEQVIWTKEGKVVGFLVSYDSNENGEVFELRKGRLIVTSEMSSGGNFLVIRDESVSPMHAIIRIGGSGDVQVLDQLSEFGTTIIAASGTERKLSGDKSEIAHGDVVIFGNRSFHVCMVVTSK